MVIGGAAEGGKRKKQIDHENRGTKEHTVVNDDQCFGDQDRVRITVAAPPGGHNTNLSHPCSHNHR